MLSDAATACGIHSTMHAADGDDDGDDDGGNGSGNDSDSDNDSDDDGDGDVTVTVAVTVHGARWRWCNIPDGASTACGIGRRCAVCGMARSSTRCRCHTGICLRPSGLRSGLHG